MVQSRLSSTIFQGDPSKAVLVQDAYKVANQESRNSMYDSVKGIYADAVDGLYTNKRSPKQLAQIVAAAQKGNINRMEMIERALGVMGTSLGSIFGSVTGVLKNKIGDAAGALIGENAKKNVQVMFDKVPLIISAVDVKDASSLFEFIGELTGDSELAKVIDIEAESAILAGIVGTLASYGVPDLIDYVIEEAQSEAARRNAWQYYSTEAVYGSDLAGINKVIDKIGLVAFLEANPDAINMILSQFFFGTKDTVDTWPVKRVELINTLVRINPQWSMYNRNGVYIPNLEPFQIASDNAKSLFYLAEPERKYSLASINFPKKPPGTIIQEMYPEAWVTA